MNRHELGAKAISAAEELLQSKGFISAVDVLMAIGKLSKKDYEDWRFRRVPHLEMVLPGSLNQFQFFLRTLRSHAHDELKLKPSRTVYMSWGKGRRQPLRFSKYGSPHMEELYSTHYVGRKSADVQHNFQDHTLLRGPELESVTTSISSQSTDKTSGQQKRLVKK
jgi:hypothetical protein